MRWQGAPLVVAAALLAAGLGVVASRAWQERGSASITHARVAPFELADLAGRRVAVLPRGRPVLINYWASWCEPCRREMPLLSEFAQAQGANGIQVVGIALDSPPAARAFLASTPVRFPTFVEAPGPADSSVRLGNARGVLPYSVLVGADGRILAQHLGDFDDRAQLEAWAAAAR